ncbi:MAG TPA: GxxExxY protein [Vicinamibacterales bacterium]|nr:GxxExxY protein [Vicinamibacterales bacterium]
MGIQPCTLPLAALTHEIRGGFFAVLQELGTGFSEVVYQRALQIVLEEKGLMAEAELALDVPFRGRRIGMFEPDLIVERLVIVEVKATKTLDDWAKAQLLNYLKCAGGGVGLLANFGSTPEIRRFVMGNPHNSLPRLSKTPVKNLQRWLATTRAATELEI